MQALPVFTFANQAGLDLLETTLVALQDITLEKIFDDHGRKNLCSEFPQIMQQVSHFLINTTNRKDSTIGSGYYCYGYFLYRLSKNHVSFACPIEYGVISETVFK